MRFSRTRFLIWGLPWALNSLLMLLILLGQETRGLGGMPAWMLFAATGVCWLFAVPGFVFRAADNGIPAWQSLLLWIGTTIIFPLYVLVALLFCILPGKMQPPSRYPAWWEWLALPLLLALPSLAVHAWKLQFVPAHLR